MVIRRLPFKYLDFPATPLPENFGEDDLNMEEEEDLLMKIPTSPESQEQNDDQNQTSNKLSESNLTANQKSFKCGQCKYMTKDADMFEKHIHSAHGKRSICSLTSDTKTSSRKQVASDHELDESKRKKRTRAGVCLMSSNSSKYDELAEKSISSIKVEEIPDCDKSKDYLDHVAADDGISSECPISNPTSSFNVPSEKSSNYNVTSAKSSNHNVSSNKSFTHNVTSEASYKCTACNFNFNTEDKLRRHTSIVHEKLCSNFTTQPYSSKVNNESRHFKCYLCSMTCDSKQNMKNHFSVVHNLGVRKDETKPKLSRPKSPLVCVEEARSISPTNDIKLHLDENCFKCNKCDRRLKTQKLLDIHLASFHKLFYKYKCRRCDKKFDSNNLLSLHIACVHMQTENGNLHIFQCANCSTSFNNEVVLRRHQYLACTHCSFKCSICFELFSDQQSLTSHIESNHKDLQTFKSNFCSFEFATESQQIASIVKEDHCGNIYKCNHCTITSIWSKKIYNHVHAINNKFLQQN